MDSTTLSPASQPTPRAADHILIQPLSNQTVIRECVKFGRLVSTASLPRQKAIEIDVFIRPAAPVAHHGGKRPSRGGVLGPFDLQKKFDQLG
jgi:hypothetical protein